MRSILIAIGVAAAAFIAYANNAIMMFPIAIMVAIPFWALAIADADSEGLSMDDMLPDAMRDFKVLIVDDDISSTLLLQKALKSTFNKVNIEFAEDGEKAVNELANHEYDLVFMDHEMPDLKGPEVVKLADSAMANKSSELRNHKTKVITYTAHPWQDWDSDKLKYMNVAGHLIKGSSFAKMKGDLSDYVYSPLEESAELAA